MNPARGLGMLLAVLLAAPLARAEPTARARLEPPQIHVGETADLLVEVQGVQSATAPRIGAPDGVSVRYVGPQTEVSITNGQMNSSVTHHYTVLALSPGAFDIGPIIVDVAGKGLDAGTVRLTALGAGAPTSPPVGSGTAPASGGLPLRLELRTPQTEIYLHQRVPLTVLLSVGSIRVDQVQYPTVPGEGFALEKFLEPTQREDATADGRVQVVEFTSWMTPLKTGRLSVGPGRLTLQVIERRRGRSAFDQFFGGNPFGMAGQPVDLTAPKLDLTVLPLPDAGRPETFSGSVGKFAFDVRVAPTDVAAGDPITVTITIRGDGDIDRVTPPAMTTGGGLRVYAVQPHVPKPGEPEMPAGTRVFEQVILPERADMEKLPALTFSYFDPSARAYRTVTRGPFPITVHSVAGAAAPQIVGATAPRPTVVAPLGADIVSIKDQPGDLRPLGLRRWRSPLFWCWQPVPLLIWAVAAQIARRRRRLLGDVRLARFTRAGAGAARTLAEARRALAAGEPAGVPDQLARTLAEYLAAKLDLPAGTVTTEAPARLRARGVDAHLAEEVAAVFAWLEQARFAPVANDADLHAQIARAEGIVRSLERDRRLARALRVVALLVGVAATVVAATPEGAQTIFFRANALYAEGRWADAAGAYEQVLGLGKDSGELYFNLGNAWAKANDLGRALHAYERAGRLLPRDPDLIANRAFVRERAGLPVEEPTVLDRLAFPLAQRMTADELLGVLSVVWTAGLFLLAAAEIVPALAPLRRSLLASLAVGLVVLLPQAAYRLATIELRPAAVVTAAGETTVRFEPQPSGTPHFPVRPGTVLRVLGDREGWVQVEGAAGRRGWIPLDAVSLL